MTDLRERAPAQAVMDKLVSLRGTPDLVELPLGIVRLSKDGVSWLRGVRGELKTAQQLRALGEEWTVLHSVPVGERGSDLDHLAIGPTGVFCINSKRLLDRKVWVAGGRFLVDGHHRDYLRNSDFEATRVEKVLARSGIPIRVIPVISVCGAKSLRVKQLPSWNGRNIGVSESVHVAGRIKKRDVRLSPAQVDLVVDVLRDPAQWGRKPIHNTGAVDARKAFDLIDRGVTRWNIMIMTLSFVPAIAAIVGAQVLVAVITR